MRTLYGRRKVNCPKFVTLSSSKVGRFVTLDFPLGIAASAASRSHDG
jgi:hypothetical protein